ncbi:hypothetical protein BCV72DRAFT_227916 [Rhizopus microsporus var. microsporus]|uniref:Uncharacterized protein n=1 Tax=Rhizopus microsporus var. microsporus TaxID=86635 RepID=A0A1X0R3S8_RHIZD|nr:hypothetical protein BCV72DRAFT_227916 [Rhizopus microsporus var. microsporus]
MTTDCVPNEHMRCLNVLDDIPKYESMYIEGNASDLYETIDLEWHHWENPETSKKEPEPSLKKLLDFAGYQSS